jgi:eukaryotic-like serine/threonine-protein kinase
MPAERKKMIGPYRLLGELGAGGMGVVRRGLHETLQRDVAIKELSPAAYKDKDQRERLRREGLALASLRHQSIVAVYDLYESKERMFLILEYVDGYTITSLLKSGPFPATIAAIVGARIASALDHAHYHRVIHRDIKPANVMISKVGEVKLMDFGIARDVTMTAMTQTGMAVGTPFYMSPEALRGEKADPRADIFSLGVLLYECLAGERPYFGKTAEELYGAIRDKRYKPLRTAAPRTPKDLSRIIERCFEPRPKSRYQAAADLRSDLETFLGHTVRRNHAAHVVAYLHSLGKISASEAQTCFDAAHLVETEARLNDPPPNRVGRLAAWAFALALAGGAVWTYLSGPGWLLRLVGRAP